MKSSFRNIKKNIQLSKQKLECIPLNNLYQRKQFENRIPKPIHLIIENFFLHTKQIKSNKTSPTNLQYSTKRNYNKEKCESQKHLYKSNRLYRGNYNKNETLQRNSRSYVDKTRIIPNIIDTKISGKRININEPQISYRLLPLNINSKNINISCITPRLLQNKESIIPLTSRNEKNLKSIPLRTYSPVPKQRIEFKLGSPLLVNSITQSFHTVSHSKNK